MGHGTPSNFCLQFYPNKVQVILRSTVFLPAKKSQRLSFAGESLRRGFQWCKVQFLKKTPNQSLQIGSMFQFSALSWFGNVTQVAFICNAQMAFTRSKSRFFSWNATVRAAPGAPFPQASFRGESRYSLLVFYRGQRCKGVFMLSMQFCWSIAWGAIHRGS